MSSGCTVAKGGNEVPPYRPGKRSANTAALKDGLAGFMSPCTRECMSTRPASARHPKRGALHERGVLDLQSERVLVLVARVKQVKLFRVSAGRRVQPKKAATLARILRVASGHSQATCSWEPPNPGHHPTCGQHPACSHPRPGNGLQHHPFKSLQNRSKKKTCNPHSTQVPGPMWTAQ